MNQNFCNNLGLCRKAGFISWGHDAAFEAIKHNKAKLILLTSDASQRLKNEFEKTSIYDGRNIEIIILPINMDELQNIIGVRAGVITVNDEGFTKLLKKNLN